MSHVTNARSAPRRRPLPATLVVLLGLFVIAGVWLLVAPRSKAQGTGDNAATVTKGRVLFERGCSSCHGLHGEGTNQAPTLIGVGAAAADFQLTTGRMPLPAPGAEAERRDPIYP
ncbi:MAG TPA: cytochrome c, partial [Kineosporiaceae bacterium]|nr:cytochrome c [Kineosporiaceae bacterium]